MTRQEIKERAKQQLGNSLFSPNWMMAVLAVLVFLAISYVVAYIPIVGGIASFVITGPMAFGLQYLFLKQARDGEKMNIGDLFKGFSDDFGQNFLLGLLIAVFTLLWSLLLIVPGIIKAYAYSMAFYIKADHPEYNWKQCMDESQRIMDGHKWELFVLELSYIGWMIVGSLCLGVGTLWAYSYMYAGMAQFYESIK